MFSWLLLSGLSFSIWVEVNLPSSFFLTLLLSSIAFQFQNICCMFIHVLQIESMLQRAWLVSFIPGEGTLDPYLVLLTNVLIYKMCKILDDRSTWVTVVISLQAFATPRKQNLFTIFSLAEMSRSHASCLVMRLVLVLMHSCTHWWVFFDSSDLSDLSHFSVGLFPTVFFELMIFIFFVTQYSLNIACIVWVLWFIRLSVKNTPSSEQYF